MPRTIKYEIPTKSNVDIFIYNAVGQKVRTLLSKEQEAGFYEEIWDGKDDVGEKVSSGVYFYQIKAGSYNAVIKMILQR